MSILRKHISTHVDLFSKDFLTIARNYKFTTIGKFISFLSKLNPNHKLSTGVSHTRASKLLREFNIVIKPNRKDN
jgi:hypothetical protein